jgi:hypothetical protein
MAVTVTVTETGIYSKNNDMMTRPWLSMNEKWNGQGVPTLRRIDGEPQGEGLSKDHSGSFSLSS